MPTRYFTKLLYRLGTLGLVLPLLAPAVYPKESGTGAGFVLLLNAFIAALLVIAAARIIALLEQIARSLRHPLPEEIPPQCLEPEHSRGAPS